MGRQWGLRGDIKYGSSGRAFVYGVHWYLVGIYGVSIAESWQ